MLTGSTIGDIKHYLRYSNVIVKLLIANVSVFLVVAIIHWVCNNTGVSAAFDLAIHRFEFPASLKSLLWQPWSAITYMFLHLELFHIGFNMLWLYWFGEIFILYLGEKKVLPLYIIGGLGGALLYSLAFNLIPNFKNSVELSHLLGASGSIYAIVFASIILNPDHEISLIFFDKVKIKYIAIALIILGLINSYYGNAGGEIAHLGGALVGSFYIISLRQGFDPINFAALFKRRSPVKVTYKNTDVQSANKNRSNSEQQKVDEILDKIARSGYDSLSKEERDFLFNYSKK